MREKRFGLVNRLLHWAIAFTVLFLLLTILLRMGWMNKDNIGKIVQASLKVSGQAISLEQAQQIGKDVRRPMWNYHILAGYVLIGLYLIRAGLTAINGIAFKNPFSGETSGKEKFRSWLYIIFYFLLAVSLFTGLMVVNGPKDLKEGMEWIHVKSLYYVVVFIIVHILGVVIADAGAEKGVISRMITGSKSKDF